MNPSARPLEGVRIVVTRAKEQASALVDQLEALGAEPVAIATISIIEPSDGGAAREVAMANLHTYDQVVVTSPNGARALVRALGGIDGTVVPPVACVGPSTAAVLFDAAVSVNVMPDQAVAEGLLAAMPHATEGCDKLLLFQAEVARPVLADGLGGLGWHVDRVAAYRTVDADISPAEVAAAAAADVVTFTSSSTVERFLRLVGSQSLPPVVASIGPITSATAMQHGLTVDIEAKEHTIRGLVEAVVAWADS